MDNPEDSELNAGDRPFSEFSHMPSKTTFQNKRRNFLAILVVGPITIWLLFALGLQVEYYFSDEYKARTKLEPGMKKIISDIKSFEVIDESYFKAGILPIKFRAVDKHNLDKFHAPPELDYKLYQALDPKVRANLPKNVKMVLHCVYYRETLVEKRHKTRRGRHGKFVLTELHSAEFVSLTLYDIETKCQLESTVIAGNIKKIDNLADYKSRIDLVAPNQIIDFLNGLPQQ